MPVWAGILKSSCHNWNQRPRVFLIAIFCGRIKMLKFETKNALFWYLMSAIWKKYCPIWNQHPKILLKEKFPAKMKVLKYRIKNTLFEGFTCSKLTIETLEKDVKYVQS